MNKLEERIEEEKEKVIEDLRRQPSLFLSLAENALLAAESLRNNYFQNTAQFVARLRIAIRDAAQQKREPVMEIYDVGNINWESVKNEIVTFVASGIGQVQISNQTPILLRVGSYCVRVGERNLAEREQFAFYPVILGDIEGGSKERADFVDIVRITAQLLGCLSILDQTPDLRILVLQGPLMYLMSGYAGHTPFTERDIDLFLRQYSPNSSLATRLKEDFLSEARKDIYPNITESYPKLVKERLFEPLTWIAFLYRQLLKKAQERIQPPIIVGTVERGRLKEFSERRLLGRVFQRLYDNGQQNYLNEIYGRTDLNTPRAFLNRLGYTDALLLSMILEPGQFSESWSIGKFEHLSKGIITLPGDSNEYGMDWRFLNSSRRFGFPSIQGSYVQVSPNNQPIRVEMFEASSNQMLDATRRVFLYSNLLPGSSVPVGLNIAEKHAMIPTWMTSAYSKLIRYHLGVSLQSGEITDAQMRRIIVQSIYMSNRDWLVQ